ncbi:hypothetical protein CR513_29854, partial [Mucuna pruriens]
MVMWRVRVPMKAFLPLVRLNLQVIPLIVRDHLMVRRFFVMGKLCSLIIDGGSSVNVASHMLVEKLSLPILVHPRPFSLAFTIGKYSDEILCDVVSVEATCILLGKKVTLKPLFPREVCENQLKMKNKRKKSKKKRK